MKRLNSGQFFYIVIRKGCKECVFLCQSHIDQIFRKRWQNYGHFSHSNCDLAAFRSQSPLEALVPIPLLTEVLSQLNEVPQFGQLFSHCDSDSRPHCDGSCIGRESDPASLGTEENSTLSVLKWMLHWPGIEPGPPAWQARILPLNHQCLVLHQKQPSNFDFRNQIQNACWH